MVLGEKDRSQMDCLNDKQVLKQNTILVKHTRLTVTFTVPLDPPNCASTSKSLVQETWKLD